MKKTLTLFALAAFCAPALTVPAIAQEAEEAQSRNYSVEETRVEFLLDDPEAAAILEELIPTVFANEMFQTMGRSQTLRAIQQFEGAVLTDEKLAEIQAAFDGME